MNYEKCYNCGADYGLHQSETERCPKNGREISIAAFERGEKQQWEETTFVETKARVMADLAPTMLEVLKQAVKKYEDEMTNPFCMDWFKKAKSIIETIKQTNQ